MKANTLLFALAALSLQATPVKAVVLDLSTMSCRQFIESSPDEIKMVLTWMDGWYKGDQDEAIIDTDVFVENAKKFGTYCAAHPSISIVTAAERVLGEWSGSRRPRPAPPRVAMVSRHVRGLENAFVTPL